MLLLIHVSRTVQVRWNDHQSEPFSVSNGVKQGGILSPALFSVYVDKMLSSLNASGVGCHIGHLFAGALGYADDIVLMAPTKSALTRMLGIAAECAEDLSLKFNGTKSKYLLYSARGHARAEVTHGLRSRTG